MIPITERFVSQSFRQRLVWIRVFFLLIVGIVVARSIYLQIIEKSKYNQISEKTGRSTIAVKLRRGPIYDADGNLFAVSLPLQSVFAIPNEIENSKSVATKLSRILNLPYKQVFRKVDSDISFTWIKRNTTPSESIKIREQGIKGIHFIKEYQRFYPMGNHTAHVLGFSGIDSRGLEGIEYQFNSHLMDNSGLNSVWNYLNGKPKLKTLSGGSLQLTIQSKLQYYAEKELKQAVSSSGAKNGTTIIMETKTGNILTMANSPDYDPNNFDRYESGRFFNRAVNATYEPGSTFKVITIATALENDVLEKDNLFYCEEGEYQIQDRVIHDVAKYGWLTLEKILQKSSNICAAKIGQRIPKPVFYKSIRDFGFGTKTGIELPGEVSGKVFNYQNWSDTDVATMSFGHSISATPIQIITAINAIATGGTLISPKIIKSAKKSDETPLFIQQNKNKKIIKPETAKMMQQFMASVVKPGGTGVLADVAGVTIAGKTGTTRKFDPREREYSTTSHISSFIGFFPLEDPQLTILVIIDEPQREYLGTKGAAPVFRKIAEHALRFYPETLGNPTEIITQLNQTRLFEENTAETSTESNTFYQIADSFKGLTLRKALALADKEGFKLEIDGSGTVREISVVNKDEKILKLQFK